MRVFGHMLMSIIVYLVSSSFMSMTVQVLVQKLFHEHDRASMCSKTLS